MRQRGLAVAGAVIVSLIASPAIAAAPPTSPPVTSTEATVRALISGPDFDGDGFADLVVGAPGECGDCVFYGAGAIHTAYGSAAGLSLDRQQRFAPGDDGMVGDSPDAREFGQRLAWGDFDGDGFDDVAVAAPEEKIDGLLDAGTVRVLYGSADGLALAGNQLWSLAGGDLPGDPGANDLFGLDLATGDFDGDDHDDLAVLSGDGDEATGPAVRVVYGSPTGLTASGTDERRPANNQDVRTIHITAGDLDGDGLDELAVGQSDVRHARGAVKIYAGTPDGAGLLPIQRWSQKVAGVEGEDRARERFGWAVDIADVDQDGFGDLLVGVRHDRPKGETFGGAIHLLRGSADGVTATDDQYVALHKFGYAGLTLGDAWLVRADDWTGDGYPEVAIGLETAGVGGGGDGSEGVAMVLSGNADGLVVDAARTITQNDVGFGEYPDDGDRFSRGLGWGDFDADGDAELVIGAAYEEDRIITSTDAGVVHVLRSSPGGWTPLSAWYPDSFGMDHYWDIGLRLGYALS